MNTPSLPPTLAERTARLKGLNERLRKNHFGIDSEIQCLLDAFAPWYKFAETQARPRCIGLWGMTGTGKSSLIRALVKEAGLEDHTYWLDAGESNEDYWLTHFISRIEDHQSGKPFIMVVDEFQHARTISEAGHRQPETGQLRKFWDLIDAGRVITWPNYWRENELKDFEARFKRAVKSGIRVRKGRVVAQEEKFHKLVEKHHSHNSTDGPRWGIPEDIWDNLRMLHEPPVPSLTDMENRLSTLNEKGILEWMAELRRTAQRTRVVDASKMLVILLGNLDELYVGEQEPLAELDPDVLRHRHRNIGRAGVQAALTKLFRIEQVGRIGRSHVVFPPIGKATVDTLIRHAVEDLAGRLSASCGLPL